MPLLIILQPSLAIFRDLDKKPIGTGLLVEEFGPLIVNCTAKETPEKYDPVNYPFSVTHKESGLLVNVFPSFDLACCAARQWAEFDWSTSPNGNRATAFLKEPMKLYKQMRDTAIYKFGGRKGVI